MWWKISGVVIVYVNLDHGRKRTRTSIVLTEEIELNMFALYWKIIWTYQPDK